MPSSFDDEVRELFARKRGLGHCSWNVFYWLYLGDNLFVTRNVFLMTWHPTVVVRPMLLLKLYPLAFLISQDDWFMGFPNVRRFLCRRDDEEIDLPLQVFRYDLDPLWPAVTSNKSVILGAGNTFGLVGSRR